MWPPRLPPLPEMSEEVRQKKLAEARKKVKGAESRLPDLAQGSLTAGPWSGSVLPLEARGARPRAPLGVPPKVLSPAPPPHPRQPSSRPRLSAPGDFGLVTPEVPGSRLGPRLLPPRTGPPGLPGLPGLAISRDPDPGPALPSPSAERRLGRRLGGVECSYVTIPLETVIIALSPVFDVTTQSPSVFIPFPVLWSRPKFPASRGLGTMGLRSERFQAP